MHIVKITLQRVAYNIIDSKSFNLCRKNKSITPQTQTLIFPKFNFRISNRSRTMTTQKTKHNSAPPASHDAPYSRKSIIYLHTPTRNKRTWPRARCRPHRAEKITQNTITRLIRSRLSLARAPRPQSRSPSHFHSVCKHIRRTPVYI